MTPKRKKRLYIILFIVFGAGLAVGLTMFALSENINLYYSTSKVANGEAPIGTRMRLGGIVVKDSVKRSPDSLRVQFDLTDNGLPVTVVFTGILPDLFREEQMILTQGKLDKSGLFQADEVLAKHDENYMPPEVADSMKKKVVTE